MNFMDFNKIIFNFDRVRELHTFGKTFPLHAIISLTNACNHKCIWCSAYEFQKDKIRFIDPDVFTHRFIEGHLSGLKAITYVGHGEPTLHRDFDDIAVKIGESGIEQGLFTNGYSLSEHKETLLNQFLWLRVSLDAGSEGLHNQLHGTQGDFNHIIKGLKALVQKRKNSYPTIGVQYGVNQLNIHELKSTALLMKSMGIDYFSVKPIYNIGAVGCNGPCNELRQSKLEDLILEVKELEDDTFQVIYRPHQIEQIETKELLYRFNHCFAGYFSFTLWEDGDVSVCEGRRVSVGNIYRNSLKEIYDSAQTQRTILGLKPSECISGCRYLPFNQILGELRYAEQEYHVNFI